MSEVVFAAASQCVSDDASTRDVILSQVQSDAALSPASGFESIDKNVENDQNNLNLTPESHSSPAQFNTSHELSSIDSRPGHESFLTSLDSVTSLTNLTSVGEDFGSFEGGYRFQPTQQSLEQYELNPNQINYNQTNHHSTDNLLQELTNSCRNQFEQGFPSHQADGEPFAALWRPIISESSEFQNYCDPQPQQNLCQGNPPVPSNKSQQGPDTGDDVIDLTESVTSLDDDSNSPDSLHSVYSSPPESAIPSTNINYELYPGQVDPFHDDSFPIEYYSHKSGSMAPSYSHIVSNQPHLENSNYSQQSFPETYESRSAPNLFEVAVAENTTSWGQPPVALVSSGELNPRIPTHSEIDQSGCDTQVLVAPTLPLHETSVEPQFARKRPTIELSNRELWLKFFELGTEMIITKAGRRMFPAVKLNIRDLDPNRNYALAIDILPVDNNRYRYVYHSSQWMAAGTTEASTLPCTYFHPDSPSRGDLWMRQAVSFDKLKLTNYEMNRKGHVILNSMHKYQPRIHLIECHTNRSSELESLLPAANDVTRDDVTTVVFPECAFTTVTAYQNQQITKLKIDRNPFAKGFRDSNKQWKPKPAAEKPKKVWSRQGDSPQQHISYTIDLTSPQYQHVHQHQHNACTRFTQVPHYNNNLNQPTEGCHLPTYPVLSKTTAQNLPEPTKPAAFQTPLQPPRVKHSDVTPSCASNRDVSMASQPQQEMAAFGFYANIPQEKDPTGNGGFANFPHSGGLLEGGLASLLYSEPNRQATNVYNTHPSICPEP